MLFGIIRSNNTASFQSSKPAFQVKALRGLWLKTHIETWQIILSVGYLIWIINLIIWMLENLCHASQHSHAIGSWVAVLFSAEPLHVYECCIPPINNRVQQACALRLSSCMMSHFLHFVSVQWARCAPSHLGFHIFITIWRLLVELLDHHTCSSLCFPGGVVHFGPGRSR